MCQETVPTGTSGSTAAFQNTSAIPTSSPSHSGSQPTNLANTTAPLTKYDKSLILAMGLLPFPNAVLSTSKTKVNQQICRRVLERSSVDKLELPVPQRVEAVLSSGEGAVS